jgi:hypothetical protein
MVEIHKPQPVILYQNDPLASRKFCDLDYPFWHIICRKPSYGHAEIPILDEYDKLLRISEAELAIHQETEIQLKPAYGLMDRDRQHCIQFSHSLGL